MLQNIIKVQASGPLTVASAAKPSVRGWLTKVKPSPPSPPSWLGYLTLPKNHTGSEISCGFIGIPLQTPSVCSGILAS